MRTHLKQNMGVFTESQITECKQIWKDDYLKTITAFANTEGGTLWIGIDDNGNITGINNTKELLEILPNKINNRLGIMANVISHTENKIDFLEITTPKSFAPISCNGKFFQRSGSNTIELNGTNHSNFLLKKYGKTWDDVAVDAFGLDQINLDTIEKFKRLAKNRILDIDHESNVESWLRKLNLYENNYLNRAAVLLFAKNPQQYFIQSHSKIGKFLNDSELLTSDIIEGNLFEQVDRILEILKTKYLKSFITYDGAYRVETLEYPYEALRETVVNALIHRDYLDTSVLQIRVYDDKIVFSNGATLSPEVPIEKFTQEHISKPYNPIIASVFYKAGLVESWGKGTVNIINECLKAGLPSLQYRYTFGAVQVTFHKKETAQENTREQIVTLLQENPKYTKNDLMKILNKADGTIKQHLANLKNEGILKRIGSTKNGYWEVKQ
jgi:ATP-dependent DNA helicase RecG